MARLEIYFLHFGNARQCFNTSGSVPILPPWACEQKLLGEAEIEPLNLGPHCKRVPWTLRRPFSKFWQWASVLELAVNVIKEPSQGLASGISLRLSSLVLKSRRGSAFVSFCCTRVASFRRQRRSFVRQRSRRFFVPGGDETRTVITAVFRLIEAAGCRSLVSSK